MNSKKNHEYNPINKYLEEYKTTDKFLIDNDLFELLERTNLIEIYKHKEIHESDK